MNTIIEQATTKDIAELLQLRLAYMKDDYGVITEEQTDAMRSQLPVYLEKHLGKELLVFTVREEGQIAACAWLLVIEMPASVAVKTGLRGEVLNVYTKPEARGKHYCTKLMEKLVAYGKEAGLSRIDLSATTQGVPIYERIGFHKTVSHYTEMRMLLN